MSVLIQSALDAALTTAFPLLTVAIENEVPGSDIDAIEIETHLLPAKPVAAALGVNAMNRHTGIFQVTIKNKKGVGYGASAALAKQIEDLFYRGSSVTSGAYTIGIDRSYTGPGYYDENKYLLPVSVEYSCYLPNGY